MEQHVRKYISAAIVTGLVISSPAISAPPGPGVLGSLSQIEAKLEQIEAKLGEIETKVDNQSTDLRGVAQNWDKKLDSTNGDTTPGREGCDSDRFTCIFDDTAVRDNETGIVWERAPDNSSSSGTWVNGQSPWAVAATRCQQRVAGGRAGFYLPSHEQLASLVDKESSLCAGGGPCLPDGHPFLTVPNTRYWTTTTSPSFPSVAATVNFENGFLASTSGRDVGLNYWCARGGQTHNSTHEWQ